MIETRWFFKRELVLTQDDVNYQTGDPYYNNTKLTIPMFTNSYSGKYTCSPSIKFPTVPPGDTITLNYPGD